MINYVEEIKRLKKEKKAVILAHYYQVPEVQDVADFLGDSLALSIEAQKTDAEIIVFCGVHFMAETAKILSPSKKVLLPVLEAGCPMANMINEKSLQEYIDKHPNVKVLCYVNSTAKTKALSDVCVTSSNALKIIKHYMDKKEKILYCPDQNLGIYAMDKEKWNFDVWPGHCCIHNDLNVGQINDMRKKHPNALVLTHPEARLEVLKASDYVGSTKQIIEFAKKSDKEEFIIGTEEGILHKLRKDSPNKKFYMLSDKLRCYDMKLTSIKDVYECLLNETNEIIVPEETRQKAEKSLKKMIELS